MWLFTLQFALTPHKPGQGSTHFCCLHALSEGQSWFRMHSGLQLGGEPVIPGRQVQSHLSPFLLGKFEYCPQGLGSHGSSSITGSIAKINKKILAILLKSLLRMIFFEIL
jgi:hypothetical protein